MRLFESSYEIHRVESVTRILCDMCGCVISKYSEQFEFIRTPPPSEEDEKGRYGYDICEKCWNLYLTPLFKTGPVAR